MDRDALRQVIRDQREYKLPKEVIPRSLKATLERFKDDPSILIISGMRRSGKSTLQRIFQMDVDPSDYYLNFDDERLIKFSVDDFQTLLEVFIELFGEQSTFYFDEIQNIKGWERFVRRLYSQEKKIYITGSNANLLSKELGTHLTGRYLQFEAFPLSFEEIVRHKIPDVFSQKGLSTSQTGMILQQFSNYLKNGGVPEFVKHGRPEYLESLLQGILYRDIIARYKLTEERPLLELVYYFASNIGKEFSYTKLANVVGLSSPHTVANYCNYLEQCYLSFFLTRYSPSLQKQLQHNKKCYMIDPGIIRITGFRASEDRGRLLENVVFLQLKMQGKEIYFHKEQKECDFLVREKNRIVEAIQVAMQLKDEDVRKREIAGLIEALDVYGLTEGTILVEEGQELIKEGRFLIRVIPIWKWLLGIE